MAEGVRIANCLLPESNYRKFRIQNRLCKGRVLILHALFSSKIEGTCRTVACAKTTLSGPFAQESLASESRACNKIRRLEGRAAKLAKNAVS